MLPIINDNSTLGSVILWLGAVQILSGERGSGEGYVFCLSAEGRVVGLSRFQETDFFSFCIHILFHYFLVTFISSKK